MNHHYDLRSGTRDMEIIVLHSFIPFFFVKITLSTLDLVTNVCLIPSVLNLVYLHQKLLKYWSVDPNQ
jgi:hypothetical protein